MGKGAKANIQDTKGKTALIYFCERKGYISENTEAVAEMAKVTNIDIQDKSGMTALMHLLENKKVGLNMVKELIKTANLAIMDMHKKDALSYAFYNGNIEIVKLMINEGVKSGLGQNELLIGGIKAMDMEVVSNALKNNADVNAKDSDGNTPLILAATVEEEPNYDIYEKHTALIKLLLDNGTDINAQNNTGETALMKAVQSLLSVPINYGGWSDLEMGGGSYFCLLEVLLNKGADKSIQDNSGQTALMYATNQKSGHGIIDKIVDDKTINLKDNTGKTALIYAIINEADISIIEALLAKGADINVQDNDGMTAVNIAVNNRSFETIKSFKRATATELIMKYSGTVKEDFLNASIISDISKVKELIKQGVDVNEKDTNNKTALIYAS